MMSAMKNYARWVYFGSDGNILPEFYMHHSCVKLKSIQLTEKDLLLLSV